MKPETTPLLSQRRNAFTLIEMLVVITIMVLLVSIISPAVSGALNSARRTQCASNLSQLGQAFKLYVIESPRQLLPPVNDTGSPDRPFGIPWFISISPYLENGTKTTKELSSIYRCPVYRRLRQDLQNTSNWNQLGYGMNIYLVGSPSQGWPFPSGGAAAYRAPMMMIKSPANTILLAEEKTWNWNVHSGTYAGHAYFKDNEEKKLRGHRHGKGANYLFVDGHVSFLRPADVESYLAK